MTDQAIKIQAAIDKFKQYRAALITSAVTGKIDVRNVPIPPQPHHSQEDVHA